MLDGLAQVENTPPPLLSSAELEAWLRQRVADCFMALVNYRTAPDHPAEARRRWHVYLVRHGAVMGALSALYSTRQIPLELYRELSESVRADLRQAIHAATPPSTPR